MSTTLNLDEFVKLKKKEELKKSAVKKFIKLKQLGLCNYIIPDLVKMVSKYSAKLPSFIFNAKKYVRHTIQNNIKERKLSLNLTKLCLEKQLHFIITRMTI